MRIMVLAAAGTAADDLALQLADSQGVPTVSAGGCLSGSNGESAPALEQELERQHPGQGFVLRGGPATPEQAAALDSILDALDAPLELVIGIDTGQEAPSSYAADLHPGTDPLSEYYRERGLLRRVRSEGEARDLLAAAKRIVDDLICAQRPADEDPFAAALQAIALEAPPPEANDAANATAPGEKQDAVKEPAAAAESTRPSPGWKRAAAQKGRLRRQPGGGKGRQKTRR